MQETSLETSLSSSKDKLDFDNILRVQEPIIVKSKNRLQDLLNKI